MTLFYPYIGPSLEGNNHSTLRLTMNTTFEHNHFDEKKIKTAQREALVALSLRKNRTTLHASGQAGPYERFLRKVYLEGGAKADRTGTGTLSVFGGQMRFDLSKGFPLITTKKVAVKSIIYELLWFIMGGSNAKWLQERGVTIWDDWANPETGDLGPVYGVQWRSWPTRDGGTIDQLANVIESIKSNPDSRRMLVSAWNVEELDRMALMPCHAFFQFYVENRKLSCQLYQRSADMFLGVPFNVASYALLTHMIAKLCNLEVGEFIWTGGDCHIYSNHMDQVELQLSRPARPYPKLVISGDHSSIDDFKFEDFSLIGYNPHPVIRGKVAK